MNVWLLKRKKVKDKTNKGDVMFGEKRIILRALNKRVVSASTSNILFLEEAELNDQLVTNIHYNNGRWVTVALGLQETEALLTAKEDESSEDQKNKWRAQAKVRMEMDAHKDEIRKLMAEKFAGYVQKSWSSHQVDDGTMEVKVILTKETEQEVFDDIMSRVQVNTKE